MSNPPPALEIIKNYTFIGHLFESQSFSNRPRLAKAFDLC